MSDGVAIGPLAAADRRVSTSAAATARAPITFKHRRVVAPMVGCSDLAFRLLCRAHEADLCYTEMLDAGRLVSEPEYAAALFWSQLLPADADYYDRPLIAQLSGREPNTLVAAARLIEHRVDAVDLNLGCPQRKAKDGGYGAYLLDEEHWPLVFACVSALASSLTIPVTCKIRLLPTLDRTLAFAKGLEAHGCSLLACHGRQRGSTTRRRSGPADLNTIRVLKTALTIPVLCNGNVRIAGDVAFNERFTQCDGVMVANAILGDPSLFARVVDGVASPGVSIKNQRAKIGQTGPNRAQRQQLALHYLELAKRHPPPTFEYVRAHISYLLGRDGTGARLSYKHSHWEPKALRTALISVVDVEHLKSLVRGALGTQVVMSCAAQLPPTVHFTDGHRRTQAWEISTSQGKNKEDDQRERRPHGEVATGCSESLSTTASNIESTDAHHRAMRQDRGSPNACEWADTHHELLSATVVARQRDGYPGSTHMTVPENVVCCGNEGSYESYVPQKQDMPRPPLLSAAIWHAGALVVVPMYNHGVIAPAIEVQSGLPDALPRWRRRRVGHT